MRKLGMRLRGCVVLLSDGGIGERCIYSTSYVDVFYLIYLEHLAPAIVR